VEENGRTYHKYSPQTSLPYMTDGHADTKKEVSSESVFDGTMLMGIGYLLPNDETEQNRLGQWFRKGKSQYIDVSRSTTSPCQAYTAWKIASGSNYG
jgi:hypothetical protein